MATIGIGDMHVVGSTLGINTPTMRGQEAAAQTYPRFSVLINAAGYMSVGVDPITSAALTNISVMGLSTAAATGVTGAEIIYEPFLPGITLIEANLCTGATGADLVLAQTHFGVACGLALHDTALEWVLDAANVAVATVVAIPLRVTGRVDQGVIGDTNARVVAVVCQSHFVRYGGIA